MARFGLLLSEAQWTKIQPVGPRDLPRLQGGRPLTDDRRVLERILWRRPI